MLNNPISIWLTTADQSALLQPQTQPVWFSSQSSDLPTLVVDPDQSFQPVEGFGFSLTGGSAMLISRLPETERQMLLRELFLADEHGVGISFLRLSIGASDLSESCYSYDDRAEGEDDFELTYFDIAAGDREVIPVLQAILAINPAMKIIAAPWSAPASQAFPTHKSTIPTVWPSAPTARSTSVTWAISASAAWT